ncbi:MAG: MotA/TolQ/ExbB proton channel family protein [Pseudomonadota bacterium]
MHRLFDDDVPTPRAFGGEWRQLLTVWRVGERQRTQSLLLLRFTLLNAIGCALVAAAWLQGWITPLFAGSSQWMVGAIVAVFVFGLAWCARLVMDTGAELDQLKSRRLRPGSRSSKHLDKLLGASKIRRRAAESALKIKLSGRIVGVRHVAGSLVFLGLIGTVLGFMIALSGVDPTAAGDARSIAPMVATLIDGMGLALNTTLVGAILNLWLMADYRILEHGTGKLLAELIERGAEHGDA